MSNYKYTRAAAFIDLDAALYNMNRMHEGLKKGTGMLAVIKADGYGHGAVPLAKKLEQLDYLYGFSVATLDEAVELRKAGIDKPINILGYILPEEMEDAVKYDISPVIFTYEDAKALSAVAVTLSKTVDFHIAIDTGMRRIGYYVNRESAEEIKKITELPNIRAIGAFTHFFQSDAADKSHALKQYEEFKKMQKMLKDNGVDIPLWHCSNSAALMEMPQVNMDLVRAGISLYGLAPSDEIDISHLKPIMTLKARVTHIKTIYPGDTVSYGGTFMADKEMKIATIGFGYADGYPRQLSNKGYVLIHGKRAPIVGRVCMDQFMVDISGIENVVPTDEVTIMGRDKDECITAEVLGDLSGRFNYELVCCISKRVPRVYLD